MQTEPYEVIVPLFELANDSIGLQIASCRLLRASIQLCAGLDDEEERSHKMEQGVKLAWQRVGEQVNELLNECRTAQFQALCTQADASRAAQALRSRWTLDSVLSGEEVQVVGDHELVSEADMRKVMSEVDGFEGNLLNALNALAALGGRSARQRVIGEFFHAF